NEMITISASGGPFIIQPDSAYMSPQTLITPFIRTFNWQTECTHVRKAPYDVLFKAEDDHRVLIGIDSISDTLHWVYKYDHYHLVAFQTTHITVVSPSPKNPAAIP